MQTYSTPDTLTWNTISYQDQASLGFPVVYDPFLVNNPVSHSLSPANPHFNRGPYETPMAGMPENTTTLSPPTSADDYGVKLTQLVALLKDSEEKINCHYAQTMLEVNSLVYELVSADERRFDELLNDTNHSPCHICNGLKIIGKLRMEQKVESERLLLEAIAVSEGRFGEHHLYSFHLMLNLLLLYSDWGCRGPEELLDQILKASYQAVNTRSKSVVLICMANEIDWKNIPQIAYWCSLGSAISSPVLAESAGPVLEYGSFEALTIDEGKNQKSWQGLLDLTVATHCSWSQIISVFELILPLCHMSTNDLPCIWIAAFSMASISDSDSIFKWKHKLSDAAAQSSSPSSAILKASLDCLETLDRLKNFTKESRLCTASSTNQKELLHEESHGSLQSADILVRPIKTPEELMVVLAEVALDEIVKSDAFQNAGTFVRFVDFDLFELIESAIRLGHFRLITLLKKLLTDPKFELEWELAELLNSDGGWDDFLSLSGVSLLCSAVKSGHIHVVKALLDAGARVNGPENRVPSPLSVALYAKQLEIARLLIEEGARVGVDETAMIIKSINSDLFKAWMENVFRAPNWKVIFYGISRMSQNEYLDVLLRQTRNKIDSMTNNSTRDMGLFEEEPLSYGRRELSRCVAEKNDRGLQLLLYSLFGLYPERAVTSVLGDAIVPLTARPSGKLKEVDLESKSPILHILVSKDAPKGLSIFLALGPSLTTRDVYGNTALHLAAYYDRIACATELLRAGINTLATDALGQTAFQIASQNGHQEMAALLMGWNA